MTRVWSTQLMALTEFPEWLDDLEPGDWCHEMILADLHRDAVKRLRKSWPAGLPKVAGEQWQIAFLRHLIAITDELPLCGICGSSMSVGARHVDHRIPLSKGGAHHIDNLQWTHARCNLRKGAKYPPPMVAAS